MTAVGLGTTTITASAEGKSGSVAVSVGAQPATPVATVTVTLTSSSLAVGQTTQATAMLRDASGNILAGRTVTWSSASEAVATVDSTGMVTANGVGTTTVTAASEGTVGTTTITVFMAAPNIRYTGSPYTLTYGTAATPVIATNSGGAVVNCSITPALPVGLILDIHCTITGSPEILSDPTVYSVTATNEAGSSSTSFQLRVTPPPPTIQSQPSPAVAGLLDTATFSVTASGTGPLTYQWRRNGANIAGATLSTYTTPPLTSADDGSRFSVVIRDSYGGSIVSGEATLTAVRGRFTFTGSMPGNNPDRSLATGTLLPNGKVLIVDGNALLYDPESGSFEATGSPAYGRNEHTATLLANGTVLVAGGYQTLDRPAEIYDPLSGAFTLAGMMNQARRRFTATLLSSGKVLIVGGLPSNDRGGYSQPPPIPTAELYDPASGSFTLTNSPLYARWDHFAELLPNGQVVIMGGVQPPEIYDPVIEVFRAVPQITSTFGWNATATQLQDGRVMAGPAGNSFFIHDFLTPSTVQTPAMLTGRFGFNATTPLANGKVLIAGGRTTLSPPFTYLQLAEIYNPISNTFAPTGSMMVARERPVAVRLQNGKVLVIGGFTGDYNSPYLNSAEIYDPQDDL